MANETAKRGVEKNVFIESAIPGRLPGKNGEPGRKVVNVTLRTAMDNEKGGNSFPVTVTDKEGKPRHSIMLNAEPAKSGPNAGKIEAVRFAEAGGFKGAMQEAIKDKNFDKAIENKEHLTQIENKGLKIKMYDYGKGSTNSIYYKDAKGNLVPEQVKVEKDGKTAYEANPDARYAHVKKPEETIKPWRGFDPEKNAQQVKEAKEAKAIAKEALEKAPTAPAKGAPEAPSEPSPV